MVTATTAERRAWSDLLHSLAAFPTVVASVKPDVNHTINRTIFSEAETTVSNSSNLTSLPDATRGSAYWHSNMGYPITHLAGIYPAAVVQRGDDPELVKVARATLLTAGECFPEATCKGWSKYTSTPLPCDFWTFLTGCVCLQRHRTATACSGQGRGGSPAAMTAPAPRA